MITIDRGERTPDLLTIPLVAIAYVPLSESRGKHSLNLKDQTKVEVASIEMAVCHEEYLSLFSIPKGESVILASSCAL
jgi:hypothetical protein